jgi:hypothetical protein
MCRELKTMRLTLQRRPTYFGVSRKWGQPASMLTLGVSGGKDFRIRFDDPLDYLRLQ